MKKRGLIFINAGKTELDILEQMFALPVEERTEFLLKALGKKAVPLGSTELSAPELAVELLKRGVKAKSYIKGEKRERNNP